MKKTVFLLFILTAVFLAFSSSLNNDFTNWDDNIIVINNPLIRSLSLENIHAIFTGTDRKGYIPLTILSFAVEYHFFQLNPFVYHLTNLLLHLVVTGLVFWFALQTGLTLRAAGFAALLFGIHPIHVESVAWITERKDVLYAVFYMLSLCFYWRYTNTKRSTDFLISFFCGILSMLAKPMALSLPLILVLCDWFRGRRFDAKCILEKVTHLLYIIPLIWIALRLDPRPPVQNTADGILIWIWTLTFYIKKFFLPLQLSPLYPLPEPVTLLNLSYATALIVLAVWIGSTLLFRRERRLIFAGAFYFFSIFFLLRYNNLEASLVGDRYMYLPSVGFCFFVGYIFDRIGNVTVKKFSPAIAVFILVTIFLGVRTFQQANIWQDSVSLWKSVIEHNPTNNSRMAVLRNNRYQQQLVYAHLIHHVNSANAFAQEGKHQQALGEYDKALEFDPNNALVFYNRGNLYLSRGEFDRAVADYTKSIARDPENILAYNNRGGIYFYQQRYKEALADFNKILSIDPNFQPALDNIQKLKQVLP